MATWTASLSSLTFVQRLDDNTDIFLCPNTAAPTNYLKRMTFSTHVEADKQYYRETLAFGHSHQSIIETWEVAIDHDAEHWYVYVSTPYLQSLSQDMMERKTENHHYSPDDLWTYMKDLVAAFAYLQQKVRNR